MKTHTEYLTIPVEVEDGYELTGEYRPPARGKDDLIVQFNGSVTNTKDQFFYRSYPIARKVWKPDDWMPKGWWLFQIYCGDWYLSDHEPYKSALENDRWQPCVDAAVIRADYLAKALGTEFIPPPETKVYIPSHLEAQVVPDRDHFKDIGSTPCPYVS